MVQLLTLGQRLQKCQVSGRSFHNAMQPTRPIPRSRRDARTPTGRMAAELRRRIGLDLRRMRVDAGLSIRTVAAAAKIDPSHLSLIERGLREPSLAVLAALQCARVRYQRSPLPDDGAIDPRPSSGGDRRNVDQESRPGVAAARRGSRSGPGARCDRPGPGQRRACRDRDPFAASKRRAADPLGWCQGRFPPLCRRVADALGRRSASGRQTPRHSFYQGESRHRSSSRRDVFAIAYPGDSRAAREALTGTGAWPGSSILWARVEGGHAELLQGRPRGLRVEDVVARGGGPISR
jgi:transcriptional regulator with XRE-family HTH domain